MKNRDSGGISHTLETELKYFAAAYNLDKEGIGMRAKEESVGLKLAQLLDIPLDTAVDWPRITLNANRGVTVQNHRGVIEYDQSTVRINTKLGEMALFGSKLTLISALKDEIVVEGKIERLELIDWR
jgi:sporulation protein YqfC